MRTVIDTLTGWDITFFTLIYRLNQRLYLNRIVPLLSHSADGYYYPLLPFAMLLLSPDEALRFLSCGLAAFGLEVPLFKLIKAWLKRPRPFERLAGIDRRIIASDEFSFPSGHTAGAFLAATLVAGFLPALAPPAYLWATLVGFSRIYLGMHYPTDTLAGAALGLGAGLTGLAIFG